MKAFLQCKSSFPSITLTHIKYSMTIKLVHEWQHHTKPSTVTEDLPQTTDQISCLVSILAVLCQSDSRGWTLELWFIKHDGRGAKWSTRSALLQRARSKMRYWEATPPPPPHLPSSTAPVFLADLIWKGKTKHKVVKCMHLMWNQWMETSAVLRDDRTIKWHVAYQ